MEKKTCLYCHKDSYSAYDNPRWICPYCQKEIRENEGESEKSGKGKTKILRFRASQRMS